MRFPAIPLRSKKTCDSHLPPDRGRRCGTVLFYEGINCHKYTTSVDKKATAKPPKNVESRMCILFILSNSSVFPLGAIGAQAAVFAFSPKVRFSLRSARMRKQEITEKCDIT